MDSAVLLLPDGGDGGGLFIPADPGLSACGPQLQLCVLDERLRGLPGWTELPGVGADGFMTVQILEGDDRYLFAAPDPQLHVLLAAVPQPQELTLLIRLDEERQLSCPLLVEDRQAEGVQMRGAVEEQAAAAPQVQADAPADESGDVPVPAAGDAPADAWQAAVQDDAPQAELQAPQAGAERAQIHAPPQESAAGDAELLPPAALVQEEFQAPGDAVPQAAAHDDAPQAAARRHQTPDETAVRPRGGRQEAQGQERAEPEDEDDEERGRGHALRGWLLAGGALAVAAVAVIWLLLPYDPPVVAGGSGSGSGSGSVCTLSAMPDASILHACAEAAADDRMLLDLAYEALEAGRCDLGLRILFSRGRAGLGEASYYLATAYDEHSGTAVSCVTKDRETAIYWYEKARLSRDRGAEAAAALEVLTTR